MPPDQRELKSPPTGAVFWADSQDGIGQEDQGRHPWVVISGDAFHKDTQLVMAVPLTSAGTRYRDSDIYIWKLGLVPVAGVAHPLDPQKLGDGLCKCAKLRSWSIERVQEPIAHASVEGIAQIKAIVVDVLRLKPLSKKR
jgi:mRNA-degrading endonuclease toxin of MazEF toxin-antitoxin module